MNDDQLETVAIDSVDFEQRNDVLPPELVDRITLIHHAFRDYLSVTLEKTIDNFKYDADPEREVRVWEHMAQVVLTLRYRDEWPEEKVGEAAGDVLSLSMGGPMESGLSDQEKRYIEAVWQDRQPQ